MNTNKQSTEESVTHNICIVGSSGGHLIQCYNLKSWWEKYDHFWVTFDKVDAKSMLSNEDNVMFGYYPTNRNIINLFRNLVLAVKILFREKPSILFSTGAGLAIPFFFVGKLMGATLIYLEVYDRIDSPSLTGRLLYHITDLFLVQWEEQRKFYPRAELWGQAL
jgi:UDP-N-acetylglucosamine:LPS N-acetylglucosamine transferase